MQVDTATFSRRLGAIGEVEDVATLRRATLNVLALFGITGAYFVAPLSADVRVPRAITAFGLSWIWERQYRARLCHLDPTPRIAIERLAPVRWPDDLVDAELSTQEKRYLAIVAQHGLGRGVGIACFGPSGRSGFLGAVLPSDASVPDELGLQRLQTLGQVSFQQYCRMVRRAQEIPPLSNREVEVLHWIGRGKSNSVIAQILGISSSSVDVYIRRIFAKLGVTDRTTASVKAHSLGLLVSADYEQFVRESTAHDGSTAISGDPDEPDS